MATQTLDVKAIIDEGPFRGYRVWVFAMCFLLALLDGYDSQSLGAIGPAVMQSLKMQPAEFGQLFSFGGLGVLIGTIVFGMLADRFGRKTMLILSVVVFSAFSIAMAWSTNGTELLYARFLSSIGLGGAVPNALSLASEYAPRRMRASLVAILWAALPAGGVVGSFAGAWLAPTYGWASVYLLGGVIPLIIAACAIFALPESVAFLVAVGGARERIAAILQRVDAGAQIAPDAQFVSGEMKPPGLPVRHLFTQGRAAGTLLIWTLFFMSFCSMLTIVAFSSALVRGAGFSLAQASATLGWYNIGSLVASVTVGALIDRYGAFRILSLYFLTMAVVIGALGFALTLPFVLVCALYVAVGFFTGGSNSGIIALGTLFYPVPVRGTGIGWAYAVGRFGTIIGPLVGGNLMQAKWDASLIYLMIGAPALVAVATTLILKTVHSSAAGEHAPAAA